MSNLMPFFDWLNWAISTIWEALIEFCSIVLVPLAWPILIAFCFWNTRSQVRDAIDRLLELNRDGARFAGIHQGTTPHIADGLENGIGNSLSDLENISNEDPTLLPFIERVQFELNQINPKNPTDLLILALSRQNREMARISLLQQLYLSQIEALEFLSAKNIANQEQLLEFYIKHRNYFKGSPYPTFADWISYLIRFSMVEYNNGYYSITKMGKTAVKLIETFTPAERSNRLV